MASILDQVHLGGRITVIRLRSLGDCVLTTPGIRLLKQFRPDLQVSIVVEDRFREVYRGNPDVAATISPGLAAARGSDLVLNLHGGPTSAWMTLVSGAKWRAGFAHYPKRFVYNVEIPRAQQILKVERTVHTAEHVASAFFHLGVPQCEIPKAQLFYEGEVDKAEYAVLHPFATREDKFWPAKNFLHLASLLKKQGLEVRVICGPGEDPGPFSLLKLLRNLSLEELKRQLAGARLFVGNDSGPAHMAAALATPLMVLFGPSDRDVWYPWKANGGSLQAPDGDLRKLPVEDVLASLRRLQVTV
jgi:heptosyltransferase III